MPIYEYRRPDGTTFEVLQSFSDPPLKKDPETGAKVERVLHAPAVHFKGKGFYNTDYGTRKRQRETASAGGGEKSGDGSSGAEKAATATTDGGSTPSSGGKGDGKAAGDKGSSTGGESAAKAKPVAAGKN